MAVLVTTIQRFIGTNADDKPTAAPAGSLFYETDTEAWFVWDGSSWTAAPTMASQAITADQYAAIQAADSPDAGNEYVTASAQTTALAAAIAALTLAGIAGAVPEVPATPDAQDVVDALLTLGLVTQAAP